MKCWAGWLTSWSQDCQEKYQQPQICRWYHFNGRKWRGTKEPLDKGERGEWKSWFKIQHSKKWRLWHLVLSLHGKEMGKKWKQCQISFSWALKSPQIVTAAMKLKDACPWKNSYVKLRQHFKKQDITLLTKVHIVNAMVFPVVRYGCEIWTRKESECRRIDTFELRCWRRLLRVPWTARTSNQSILK